MDNAEILEQLDTNLTDLELKARQSDLADRMKMKPMLAEARTSYDEFQEKLISGAIVITDKDLEEMEHIKADIDAAAQTQEMVAAIARTATFIATKVAVA